jgi:NTE family protein
MILQRLVVTWRAGYHDARRTLRHTEVLKRPENHEGVFTFDLAADGRELEVRWTS